ncbi:MAG: ABC transporter ATP-binding protein [Deltaproteobacteria bacterium]
MSEKPWFPTYLRLWRLLLRHRAPLAWAVGAMAVGAAATGAFAALTGPALKMLYTGGAAPGWLHGPLGDLVRRSPGLARALLPAALVGVALVRAACGYVQTARTAELTLTVTTELQEALHAKLLGMPISFYDGRHTGELFSRFANDLGEVQRALGQGMASSLRDSLQIASLLLVSAWLDPRLLGLAIVAVPVTVWPIARFASALRRIGAEAQGAQASIVASVQEAIAASPVLTVYGAEESALRIHAEKEDRLRSIQRRSFVLRSAFTPSLELLAIGALAGLLFYVLRLPRTVAPERLLSFLGAILLAYQPLKSLASGSQWLFPGIAAAEGLFALLDSAPAIRDPSAPRPLSRARGEIRFDGVTVRYGGQAALRELTLEVRAGETIGIVGPSGAGKTTLLHLLPRLLDPTEGSVSLDGSDVRGYSLLDLRRNVALVAQETFLFDASVEENVTAAAPGASRREVEAALDAAGALGFVRALPEGLETAIGERGARLSGGQRQRLAIARALLKDAPVVLLDEATSALDLAIEAQVQEALARLVRGRTVLVVAHRLSTVQAVDRLVVLDGGQISEMGSPSALRQSNGLFSKLLALQEPAAKSA